MRGHPNRYARNGKELWKIQLAESTLLLQGEPEDGENGTIYDN